MPARFGWRRNIATLLRLPNVTLAGYPAVANIEVTRRCNAQCDFCRYPHTRRDDRLDDYVPVVRRLKPLVVALSGGEPLLRGDLERIIADIRREFPAVFISLVTNGSLLTVARAVALWRAGLDQLAVSLDFPDERHDLARGIPNLARHVMDIVPQILTAGFDRIMLETVVKADNLDAIPPLVAWAETHGVKVAISTYTAVKSGNAAHTVAAVDFGRLRSVIDWLVDHKGRSSTVVSSSYYLRRIPEFFEHGVPGCGGGTNFVDVRPDGFVQPCHDLEAGCHYSEWRPGKFERPDCSACWCSCRGESEAPLSWEKVKFAVAAYYTPDAARRGEKASVGSLVGATGKCDIPGQHG